MRRELYDEALEELSLLQEHLHLHGDGDDGAEHWVAQIEAMLRRAVAPALPSVGDEEEEVAYFAEEPPVAVA